MKTTIRTLLPAVFCLGPLAAKEIPNPAIDYPGFARLTRELQPVRKERRLTEAEFIVMATEPGTLVLDARSRDKYLQIHVKGAVNLPLTDFTEEALRGVIPDKTTRILIYCNNNFLGDDIGFPGKMPPVSLNIQTFINLHAYGYKNVYELGPLKEIRVSGLSFEGTSVTNP